jgi:hypothetical protein
MGTVSDQAKMTFPKPPPMAINKSSAAAKNVSPSFTHDSTPPVYSHCLLPS